MPTVSVTIPAKGASETIAKAIQSLQAQTIEDWECIIRVEGMDLPTYEAAEAAIAGDDRFDLDVYRPRHTLPEVRNRCLDACSGEYIAVLDADDVSHPRRFEYQLAHFEQTEDLFLSCAPIEYVIHDHGSGYEIKSKDHRMYGRSVQERLKIGFHTHHSSVMFRNEGVRYREKFVTNHDYDLLLRLLTDGRKLEFLDEYYTTCKVLDDSHGSSNQYRSVAHAVAAKNMYVERRESGTDSYNQWNPEEYERLEELSGS